jgi:excisionase family DNA binding protein
MSGSVRCPQCGHLLFAIELPIGSGVQAREVSQPQAPLLLRAGEAAQLLNVSRSAMYELVASGQVPVIRLGPSVRVVRKELEGWVEAPMPADHDTAP